MFDAKWTDGKRTIVGQWAWIWHRQRFVISVAGRRTFEVAGDVPEFGKFKLVKEQHDAKAVDR